MKQNINYLLQNKREQKKRNRYAIGECNEEKQTNGWRAVTSFSNTRGTQTQSD